MKFKKQKYNFASNCQFLPPIPYKLKAGTMTTKKTNVKSKQVETFSCSVKIKMKILTKLAQLLFQPLTRGSSLYSDVF